jgi:SAM-dependent methyltransferase
MARNWMRSRRAAVVDTLAPPIAERVYRTADAIAKRPWRDELTALPAPVDVDGRVVDVVDDLVAYTQLPRDTVTDLSMRRRPIDFRSEWFSTPQALRSDHWFYLGAKSYLFGNAVHFSTAEVVERYITPNIARGGAVLDFGAGVGTLAIMAAAAGFEAVVTELNALQRDFIRFRISHNGLEDRVQVLDPWEDIPRERFDAVIAIDVLEHLPDGQRLVDEQLLPSLRERALIVENTRFVVNASNPMHHLDWGLDPQLEGAGFGRIMRAEDGTRVWRRG